VLVLAVLALGGEGLLRPGRRRRNRQVTQWYVGVSGRLRARGLRKAYGEVVALAGLDLDVGAGEVVALTGPNGSGKTTALRLVAGTEEPDAGTVAADGGVARTLQATATFGELTALEHVLVGSAARRRHGGLVRTLFATPKARAEAGRFEAEARGLLERVGLAARADTPAGELTHAEQRLLSVATAAATGAGVLLLDEPSAGAARGDVARLATVLRGLAADGAAVLVVEHDLGLVRSVADRVVALDAGSVA
jgi:branched-chain amino acid transport system permease protein